MNISLVNLQENPHFVVPQDGKYMVRVTRTTDKTVNGHYTSVNHFDCRVKPHLDTKRNIWLNSFDCTGTVTHVSSHPLK
jgi:hypothetical protein